MRVVIDDALADVVQVGILMLDGIVLPGDEGQALWQRIETECETVRDRYRDSTVGQVPGVKAARRLYRSIGIDPTKTRPSSEALLRRAVKGKPLYRIHPLVDLFNLVSLTRLTPVGLYDVAKIVGNEVTIRIGGEGEGYDGIRKGFVNLHGRFVVADGDGPFGSPTSDSPRTAIDGSVSSVLVLFFCPKELEKQEVNETLHAAEALALVHLHSRTVLKSVISH